MLLRVGFYFIATILFILWGMGEVEINKAILMMIYWLFCYEIFKK
jgi:hypothetical protein